MKISFSWKGAAHWLLLFLQGAIVGTGAILPGVSGGVLCVAFGIYEPLMGLLSHPFQSLRKRYKMFISLLCGGLVGFILLARAVEWFFTVSSSITLALFVGLICGAIPELMKRSERSGPKKSWSSFIITLSAAFFFFTLLKSGIEEAITPNFAWYLFCGAVWGLSMVIPGLSSSSILIYMGLYQPMTAGIGSLDFSVLIPLFLGFLVTILLTARAVNWLFERCYAVMSRVILGFVLASTLMIFPVSFSGPFQLLGAVGCFSLGFAAARGMDLYRYRQEKGEEDAKKQGAEGGLD